MTADDKATRVKVDTGTGMFWFIGWLFTIAFAELGWLQGFFAILLWPWYLGTALR